MGDVIFYGSGNLAATNLAAIPIATIADGDIAYIWLGSLTRQLVFDISATDATDAVNHPYRIRPDDYSTAGVWIENIGSGPEVYSGGQIKTGAITSTNWATAVGSSYNLDDETIQLGGSQVDAAGSNAGIFVGKHSGVYKFYVGDGSSKYIKFDATDIEIKLTNLLISSADETIKLGTGNDIISLDADDATYRLAIGHATYASAPFRVTKTGAVTATSGIIGGLTLGATSLTSTNIGLHSGASAEILLGHATSYASAKIGFKNDGSGKVADGNISWTAAGVVTQTIEDGGTIELDAGADIIMSGSATDQALLRMKTGYYHTPTKSSEIRFELEDNADEYFYIYSTHANTFTPPDILDSVRDLYIVPSTDLVTDGDFTTVSTRILIGQNAVSGPAVNSIYLTTQVGGGVIIKNGLSVEQSSSTGALPALVLTQKDVSEEFIKFVGSAASGVLTQSIVDEGDQSSETRAGWIKVYVQDDGNQITDQAYYLPIYTLA